MYASLNGPRAERRLPSTGFEFIVNVPKNAQPLGYVTIANFAVRRNETREVATGSGYLSFSTGITQDRVVPIRHEALSDQSRAKAGFTLYRIVPQSALSPGEYAVVFYTSEVRVAGFFGHSGNSFFDFGVD